MRKFGLFCIVMLQPSILFAVPISEQIFLDVAGNNKVYLEISGQGEDAPLLLYVHGGPGNVVLGLLPFQLNVGRKLEKDFLVAYLHQRGAGKSPPIPDLRPQTPDWRQRQSSSGQALSQELMNINLDDVASSLGNPALFVSGRLDTIVPERTVRRDYRHYGGKKQLALLEESHHLPFIDQPDASAQAIHQFLKQ